MLLFLKMHQQLYRICTVLQIVHKLFTILLVTLKVHDYLITKLWEICC